MDWGRSRRLLIVAFVLLDLFLVALIHANGPNSALPGMATRVPALRPGAVEDPLGAVGAATPVRSAPFDARAFVHQLFGSPPKGRLTASGSRVYEAGGLRATVERGGRIRVRLPLPPGTRLGSTAAADRTAERVIESLALPPLQRVATGRVGGGYRLAYREVYAAVPVFGTSVRITVTKRGVQVFLRLRAVSGEGSAQTVLPADKAVAYFVSSGGSSDVRAIALGYPLKDAGRITLHVAPVWRITTGRGTVEVNAYTGEAGP